MIRVFGVAERLKSLALQERSRTVRSPDITVLPSSRNVSLYAMSLDGQLRTEYLSIAADPKYHAGQLIKHFSQRDWNEVLVEQVKKADTMMAAAATPWPVKARDIFDHHIDSTAWDSFRFRDSDIVIATYPKSGTTWTQQIVSQLLFQGAEGVRVRDHSPWIEMRIAPPERAAMLEAQTHRRFLKTHLPVDALVFSPRAKYLCIGRDGRDVAWSLYNYLFNVSDDYLKVFNTAPGRRGPPIDRITCDVRKFLGVGWAAMSPLTFPYGSTPDRGGTCASFPM